MFKETDDGDKVLVCQQDHLRVKGALKIRFNTREQLQEELIPFNDPRVQSIEFEAERNE